MKCFKGTDGENKVKPPEMPDRKRSVYSAKYHFWLFEFDIFPNNQFQMYQKAAGSGTRSLLLIRHTLHKQVGFDIPMLTCLTRENWEKGLLGPLGQPSMGQQ